MGGSWVTRVVEAFDGDVLAAPGGPAHPSFVPRS